MPSLKKMLQSYDLDLIERIGLLWGVDLTRLDQTKSIESLLKAMQDHSLFNEILESLPQPARDAWEQVAGHPQKIAWAQFSRKYGEVREFGPARREREAPEMHPASIAEILWYRGLIGRAFMNLPPEPREFVFIPEELCQPPKSGISQVLIFLEPLETSTIGNLHPADGRLLDHATDWLAAKRKGMNLPENVWQFWPEDESFIAELSRESRLVDQKGVPDPESLSAFFQKDRSEILLQWLPLWVRSIRYNDLKKIPGLVFEGDWQNDPCKPRKFLLEILQQLIPGEWYSTTGLTASIKASQPDFQRSSGDYDSWFIRKAYSADYLRGFDHWDEIDGALIKRMITGPLYWLGMVDLGQTNEGSDTCFRMTPLFTAFVERQETTFQPGKKAAIQILPDLTFKIPLFASRTIRYQIARFCEIRAVHADATVYEITVDSMELAQQNGLRPLQLVQVLEKHFNKPLPRALLLLADKWEKTGRAALVERQVLLRTQTPEIMSDLVNNPSTKKFIVEILSPTAAIINPSGEQPIKKHLLEQGYLTEVTLSGSN